MAWATDADLLQVFPDLASADPALRALMLEQTKCEFNECAWGCSLMLGHVYLTAHMLTMAGGGAADGSGAGTSMSMGPVSIGGSTLAVAGEALSETAAGRMYLALRDSLGPVPIDAGLGCFSEPIWSYGGQPGGSTPGPQGKSAYEVWLDAGNTGTVDDYLASLKGEPGDDGLSAYQVWLAEGNSGTEAEYLASLKGDEGDPGVGIPAGGDFGDILTKNSGVIDYDTAWTKLPVEIRRTVVSDQTITSDTGELVDAFEDVGNLTASRSYMFWLSGTWDDQGASAALQLAIDTVDGVIEDYSAEFMFHTTNNSTIMSNVTVDAVLEYTPNVASPVTARPHFRGSGHFIVPATGGARAINIMARKSGAGDSVIFRGSTLYVKEMAVIP